MSALLAHELDPDLLVSLARSVPGDWPGPRSVVPVAILARISAILRGGTHAQVEGLSEFFEALGLAVQVVDDVRNCEPGSTGRAEDIAGCLAQAQDFVNCAQARLDPLLADSLSKVVLRALSAYALERHY